MSSVMLVDLTLLCCLFLQIILRKVLQNLNLQCDEAENGQIAVDYYKQGRTYDLILMDKEMPVMDGHEVSIVTNNGCTLILHSLLRLH
jgi:CheY-like chemotaxis protein